MSVPPKIARAVVASSTQSKPKLHCVYLPSFDTSAGRSTMTNTLHRKNYATLFCAGPSRRRRRRVPPTVFSGTLFRLHPRLEIMEDRTLLAAFMVTNTSDSGPGSLRQAILDSDAVTGTSNTIDFDIPCTGVQTIAPFYPLPAITNSVTIDGSTQPGYSSTPVITISNQGADYSAAIVISAPDVSIADIAVDRVEIATADDSRLIAQIDPQGSSTSLSLLSSQNQLLVESDGVSLTDPDNAIDQHVAAGTYFLQVRTISGTGSFLLSTTMTPSSDPGDPVEVYAGIQRFGSAQIAVGDFTNNGILDIVAADGVHLGLGDGTFEAPAANAALDNPSANGDPSAIVVGEFNADGDLDVAMAFSNTDSISVSMGNGDGTFQPPTLYGLPPGSSPSAVVAGDFEGNGRTDLAVVDTGTNEVSILQNNGNGVFQVLPPIAVGQYPVSIAEGDFENNGRVDLAVANEGSSDITILTNQGGGRFEASAPIELPSCFPYSIVAGYFGNGELNLAVAEQSYVSISGSAIGESGVDILKGTGDGSFSLVSTIASAFYALAEGDFGNGEVDLAVTDGVGDVSVLLGNGNCTFRPPVEYSAGSIADTVVTGDFTGDGRLDLAIGRDGYVPDSISVLLGNGDGTFQAPRRWDLALWRRVTSPTMVTSE